MRLLGNAGTLWRVKRLLLALLAALALPASALAWGGPTPTGDAYGSSVDIEFSDSYPVDPARQQDWASYLGSIVHGPELAKLTLRLVPMPLVERICGAQALACYDSSTGTIVASPEDQLDAPPAREIVTHEYGHHIAASRSDAPWAAEDYGTKRWSSYENICAKSLTGAAVPGNEGAYYELNPGEAFAESYRVLALTKLGQTPAGWEIVDRSFYPDATALSLLEQDVTSPWTGPTVTHVRGSFGYGAVRTIKVSTSLDGSFAAYLRAPTKSRMRLALYVGGALVARGTSVRYEVCGQRSLTLKVERLSGKGAFTVDVSKP